MSMISITYEEAKFAHQKFYNDEFEVIVIQRRGWWDFPPFSFAYGASDIGSWRGLISTDGEKIVVTRSNYTNLGEIKSVFEFQREDIENIETGIFKTTITLKDEVKSLTKPTVLMVLLICIGFLLYIVPGIVLWRKFTGKFFVYREIPSYGRDFDNSEKFTKMLATLKK